MTDEQFQTVLKVMNSTDRKNFLIDSRQIIGLCKDYGIVSIVQMNTGVKEDAVYLYDEQVAKFIRSNKIKSNYEFMLDKLCTAKEKIPIQYRKYGAVKRLLSEMYVVATIPDMKVYEEFVRIQTNTVDYGTHMVIVAGYPIYLYKSLFHGSKNDNISATIYKGKDVKNKVGKMVRCPYILVEWLIDRGAYQIRTYTKCLDLSRGE